MPEIVVLAVVMLLGMAAYWSMVTFPRQREFQKRQQYVQMLNVGDEVITYGGIIGRVVEVVGEQGILYLEIADGVIIRVITAAVVQPYDPEEIARNARLGFPKSVKSE
jgi:preprotein translocase subunit YajC